MMEQLINSQTHLRMNYGGRKSGYISPLNDDWLPDLNTPLYGRGT